MVDSVVRWYQLWGRKARAALHTNMYYNYQLTDTAIRKFKPGSAPIKLTDGMGLYVHVAPTGGKWWRYTYRFNGKQKLMALGTYPDVSVEQARR